MDKEEERGPVEYDEELNAERLRVLVGGAIVIVLAGLVALVAGTLMTIVAHYMSVWLSVSETALVVSYIGLITAGVLVYMGGELSHQVQLHRLNSERSRLEELSDMLIAVEEDRHEVEAEVDRLTASPRRSTARRKRARRR